jgi:hypothetical protein
VTASPSAITVAASVEVSEDAECSGSRLVASALGRQDLGIHHRVRLLDAVQLKTEEG